METSGTISVKKYSSAEPPTAGMLRMEVKDESPSILLVDNGRVQEDMLKFIGKTADWLQEQLKRKAVPTRAIFYTQNGLKQKGFYTYNELRKSTKTYS